MSEEPDTPKQRREALVFTVFAAGLMIVEIAFGLLNTFNVIHM